MLSVTVIVKLTGPAAVGDAVDVSRPVELIVSQLGRPVAAHVYGDTPLPVTVANCCEYAVAPTSVAGSGEVVAIATAGTMVPENDWLAFRGVGVELSVATTLY